MVFAGRSPSATVRGVIVALELPRWQNGSGQTCLADFFRMRTAVPPRSN
jgi:hypothetical protein